METGFISKHNEACIYGISYSTEFRKEYRMNSLKRIEFAEKLLFGYDFKVNLVKILTWTFEFKVISETVPDFDLKVKRHRST